ncbi:MAG: 3-deoxy-D-manno-octulosonic acid transferase [Flavobacteriaceae bacterium]
MARERTPLGLSAYRGATTLLAPLAGKILRRRLRQGKEVAERIGERIGNPGLARPQGPLVWFHAASVGETNAILPLMHRIARRYPQVKLLLTTVTVTSAQMASTRMPEGTIHQFAVLDTPAPVKRFLDFWKPDLTVFAESEIWPNMLMQLKARGIPAALVNGRMSDRSFKRWKLAPQTVGWLLNAYTVCLAQSDADTRRLRELGARHAQRTGNVKFDVPAPAASAMDLAAFRSALGTRPVWVAASTHPGEEAVVLEAHVRAMRSHKGLIVLLAPRHPERAREIVGMAAKLDLKTSVRSTSRLPREGDDVFVFDTIGELGLAYRLSETAFIGGSLAKRGGQNPIEPAKLHTAILHGPYTFNFADAYAALDELGGAELVDGPLKLAQSVERLVANPAARRLRAEAAASAIEPLGGALDRSFAALAPLIEKTIGREA